MNLGVSELAPLHGGGDDAATRRGKAVQVDIRLTLGLKALGCQPVESTSPFKVLVSTANLHPYNMVDLCNIFRAKVADLSEDTVTIEVGPEV